MNCIFCDILEGKKDGHFLYEDDFHVSFLDRYPIDVGHSLVIPKKHHEKIQDLSPEENTDLFLAIQKVISKVDKLTGATLVAIHNGKDAGQEIPHVHIHLVPRSNEDSGGPIHSMFDSNLSLTEQETQEVFEKLKF